MVDAAYMTKESASSSCNRRNALLGGILLLSSVATYISSKEEYVQVTSANLEIIIPKEFAGWTEVKSSSIQVGVNESGTPDINQPYDESILRAYRHIDGRIVYLAVAWGARQRQEVKIHRPDLCYVAQGFKLSSINSHEFNHVGVESGNRVIGKRMLVMSGGVKEAVSYWIRIGSLYSESAWDSRLHIFQEGLNGRVPDGILVRASMRSDATADENKLWQNSEEFLQNLVESMAEKDKQLLIK